MKASHIIKSTPRKFAGEAKEEITGVLLGKVTSAAA